MNGPVFVADLAEELELDRSALLKTLKKFRGITILKLDRADLRGAVQPASALSAADADRVRDRYREARRRRQSAE